MFPNVLPLEPANTEVKPFLGQVLFTHGDFFAMFDAPFEHGGGWDRQMDEGDARVVVLSKDLNDKLFGGENSVGRTLRAGAAVAAIGPSGMDHVEAEIDVVRTADLSVLAVASPVPVSQEQPIEPSIHDMEVL